MYMINHLSHFPKNMITLFDDTHISNRFNYYIANLQKGLVNRTIDEHIRNYQNINIKLEINHPYVMYLK